MVVRQNITLIGAASGWGAQIRSTEDGPEQLLEYGLLRKLRAQNLNFDQVKIICPKHRSVDKSIISTHQARPHVFSFLKDLYKSVTRTLEDNSFPVVIGGDHSIAIGTWSAVTTVYDAIGKFGLIWFDAHMDAHTYQSSPSYALHGMPVACLLGRGKEEMADFIDIGNPSPKLSPEHIVLIGIRDFEAEEKERLNRLGVKIFFIQEIKERGISTVFQEALAIVNKGTKGFGVSIDLDGFDPLWAPGVGTPAPGGLSPSEVLPFFKEWGKHPKLLGLEITEYNPSLDKDHKTADLTIDTLSAFLTEGSIK